jgi:hypothetical protein
VEHDVDGASQGGLKSVMGNLRSSAKAAQLKSMSQSSGTYPRGDSWR